MFKEATMDFVLESGAMGLIFVFVQTFSKHQIELSRIANLMISDNTIGMFYGCI